MTTPANEVLRALVDALVQRKAEFEETAADMDVSMDPTITIDEVLRLLADLQGEQPQQLHLYQMVVAADTAAEADRIVAAQLCDSRVLSWRRFGG